MEKRLPYTDIADRARKKAKSTLLYRSQLSSNKSDFEDPDELIGDIDQTEYLHRSVRALISINDEIWGRIAPYVAGNTKNVLCIRAGYTHIKAVTRPSFSYKTRLAYVVRLATIPKAEVKEFGPAVLFPRALAKLVPVDRSATFPKSLENYQGIYESSLLFHEEVGIPFLLRLRDHLQELQLYIGRIDQWLMQPISASHFIQESFQVSMPKLWDTDPCKDLPFAIYFGGLDTLAAAKEVVETTNKKLLRRHEAVITLKKRYVSFSFEETFDMSLDSDRTRLIKFVDFAELCADDVTSGPPEEEEEPFTTTTTTTVANKPRLGATTPLTTPPTTTTTMYT